MGISARHLLELLIASRDDDGRYLSLVLSDDENEVSLAFDNGIKRHSIRLSLTETDAILAALNRCGVSDDDPLRKKIVSNYGQINIDEEGIERQSGPLSSQQANTVIDALIAERTLTFLYQGNTDTMVNAVWRILNGSSRTTMSGISKCSITRDSRTASSS